MFSETVGRVRGVRLPRVRCWRGADHSSRGNTERETCDGLPATVFRYRKPKLPRPHARPLLFRFFLSRFLFRRINNNFFCARRNNARNVRRLWLTTRIYQTDKLVVGSSILGWSVASSSRFRFRTVRIAVFNYAKMSAGGGGDVIFGASLTTFISNGFSLVSYGTREYYKVETKLTKFSSKRYRIRYYDASYVPKTDCHISRYFTQRLYGWR